jgi:hypothetical protein
LRPSACAFSRPDHPTPHFTPFHPTHTPCHPTSPQA